MQILAIFFSRSDLMYSKYVHFCVLEDHVKTLKFNQHSLV
jgi:hypothetical protein